MPVRFTRGRKGQDANVAELFPTYSGGHRAKTQARAGERIPAEDAEPWATNCFQCGQPLDISERDDCPFCGSTNTTGRKL